MADLYKEKIIDYAQLHGAEDDEYINELRAVAKGIVIVKSFMTDDESIKKASVSVADYIIFDPGKRAEPLHLRINFFTIRFTV